jgi:hypothetical protein
MLWVLRKLMVSNVMPVSLIFSILPSSLAGSSFSRLNCALTGSKQLDKVNSKPDSITRCSRKRLAVSEDISVL